jgi:hypothetical protein
MLIAHEVRFCSMIGKTVSHCHILEKLGFIPIDRLTSALNSPCILLLTSRLFPSVLVALGRSGFGRRLEPS